MTTYRRPPRALPREARLQLLRNRQLWREAEEEWQRAEAALREFDADVIRGPNEMLAELPTTRESLVTARDEALRRVIELDRAYLAASGADSHDGTEHALS